MVIGIHDPGTDAFDLAVNYGGLLFGTFFGREASIRLPDAPPRAVSGPDKCFCPSCASKGWYAASPFCRYWGDRCDVCAGSRVWMDYSAGRPPRSVPCDLCPEEWREDVARFRYALQHPRAAARQLREQAARAAREEVR
jgi:hypothetical protein